MQGHLPQAFPFPSDNGSEIQLVNVGVADRAPADRTYREISDSHSLGLTHPAFMHAISTGEKACSKCGRTFNREDAYRRHLREGCPSRR
ncbi:uncharacterized protein B0H18DRAFT_593973 [Fomitopsis serialis]|uniref:uncharacterized protein n=1 Tax=Fomitopsis serialis TaxID=139415 RepID=UPI00200856BA|nr:uncharacterized protein B0H18DRAFT_593973 [Neoantrodia serialis]KAH9920468.1 hypothetical protein B0H18DRAFT_593973 [Neoantrodia serialis]